MLRFSAGRTDKDPLAGTDKTDGVLCCPPLAIIDILPFYCVHEGLLLGVLVKGYLFMAFKSSK